jgi:hypothetical protein
VREDPLRQTVQLIDEYAWEGGDVDPIGDEIAVAVWLDRVRQLGLTLGTMPASRIEGGAYDGGHVIPALAAGGRLYFAVPAAAIPALRDALPAGEYAELVRRTPRLRQAS